MQIVVDLGPEVDTRGLPTGRRTRHNLEVARALSAYNRMDDALVKILEAEIWAPEQVRSHYLARELVLTWVRNQRGGRAAVWQTWPTRCMSSELGTLGCMAPTEQEAKMAHPRMAAGALFFDTGGRVLMVEPAYKEYWEIPGGYEEAEADEIIATLVRGLGCPHVSDYVFWDHDPQLTTEKIVDRALSYEPFAL